MRLAVEVLNFGGAGHTAGIHAKEDAVIRQYGVSVPAYRVVVNSPSSIGSVGYTNGLTPSMTLGCGSVGRNITSDNITARHLMNIKRVAYETRPYSAPRTDVTWHASIRHDRQSSDAPYMKALSSDVSRKGSGIQPHPPAAEMPEFAAEQSYGASGMSATEVEKVVEEFLRNRS